MMKRISFVVFLCLCLVLSLSCAPDNDKDVVNISTNEIPADEVTVDEQVVLDHDGITVTVKSLEMDGTWGPRLKVFVENKRDNSVTIQVRDLAINGVMVESIFSCEVAAGKQANDEIVFMSTDLEVAGIELIKEIEFKFHVFDTETWDTVFDSETITITTSAPPSFTQAYDDSGFVALDQDGFKIVIKYLDSKESFWGADIYTYIENNSDIDATIQIRNMSVNGFMIEPIFSTEVLAGKKAFDTITFLESDLTDNEITSIDELEFKFHIFETNSGDTVLDSAQITVTFEK
ncbi:MAG: hypothetical protein WBK03_01205 [Dethiobacteria bacterium]